MRGEPPPPEFAGLSPAPSWPALPAATFFAWAWNVVDRSPSMARRGVTIPVGLGGAVPIPVPVAAEPTARGVPGREVV